MKITRILIGFFLSISFIIAVVLLAYAQGVTRGTRDTVDAYRLGKVRLDQNRDLVLVPLRALDPIESNDLFMRHHPGLTFPGESLMGALDSFQVPVRTKTVGTRLHVPLPTPLGAGAEHVVLPGIASVMVSLVDFSELRPVSAVGHHSPEELLAECRLKFGWKALWHKNDIHQALTPALRAAIPAGEEVYFFFYSAGFAGPVKIGAYAANGRVTELDFPAYQGNHVERLAMSGKMWLMVQ